MSGQVEGRRPDGIPAWGEAPGIRAPREPGLKARRNPLPQSLACVFVHLVFSTKDRWFKRQSAGLARFAWQRGYGAFSFGQRDVEGVARYIDAQEEHHRARTFQDEYRQLLEHCGVEYDERYVWD